MSHHILSENKNGVLTLTINKQKVYNALSTDDKIFLIKELRKASRDQSVGAIVLTGEGKAFCTGQDLNDRSLKKNFDLGDILETEWNPLVCAIRESKKIIIAAINGVVAGAGLSIAMACDLIISKPAVKFISGFAQIGLCPDAGASYAFTKHLGRARTMEFFLLGAPLTSEQLQEVGLINTITDDCLQKALSIGSSISLMAPQSVAAIKSNILCAADNDFQHSLKRETMSQRFLGKTDDYQEGLKAFFEKRSPHFQGK